MVTTTPSYTLSSILPRSKLLAESHHNSSFSRTYTQLGLLVTAQESHRANLPLLCSRDRSNATGYSASATQRFWSMRVPSLAELCLRYWQSHVRSALYYDYQLCPPPSAEVGWSREAGSKCGPTDSCVCVRRSKRYATYLPTECELPDCRGREGGGGRLGDLLAANSAFKPCKYLNSFDEISKLPSSTTLFAMLATKTALCLPLDRGRKSRRGSVCSHHYEAQYALPAAARARARRHGRGGGGGPGLTLRQRAASTMQECNINFG